MRQALFAAAVATVLLAAVSGTPSQSAPIAPLPAAITQDTGGVTQVWWYRRHYWHRHYWHRHYYRHWRR